MESPSTPQRGAAASKRQSCVLCNQRKVKCNRKDPCSNCTRGRTQCVFKPHAIPRRGKARPKDNDLLVRLRRCEALLEQNGIDAKETSPEVNEIASSQDSPDVIREDGRTSNENKARKFGRDAHHDGHASQKCSGTLITEGRRTMYLESHLWTSLSEKMRDPVEMLQAQSDEDDEQEDSVAEDFDPHVNAYDLLLGPNPVTNVKNCYPTPKQASFLWQAFLDNVNVLTKCIHFPTLQPQFFEAVQNPNGASKQSDALFLAIIASAVNSLREEDCRTHLGDGKKRILNRYIVAAQRALAQANFLKSSDIAVLQAFFFFLISIRSALNPRVFWLFTGIGVRIGQGIGIHRDGATLGLSPFQTEMRRRLYWHMSIVDRLASQLAGSGSLIGVGFPDLLMPLNVNDEDLHPDMTAPPPERKGATEMIFIMTRFNFFHYSKRFSNGQTGQEGGDFKSLAMSAFGSAADREKKITELEDILESRYLRYCDPLVPLHALTMLMARSGITGIRLMAQHPIHRSDGGAGMTSSEKDQLFTLSSRIIGYHNQCMELPQLQRFRWETGAYFQFGAMVYLVGELRHRVSGPEVDEAWHQVADIFRLRPELADGKRILHIALTSLTLKAWKAREAELIRINDTAEPPPFIAAIMLQKVAAHRKHDKPPHQAGQAPSHVPPTEQFSTMQTPIPSSANGPLGVETWNTTVSDFCNFDGLDDGTTSNNLGMIDTTSPMDWAAWDSMMKDFETTDGTAYGL